MPQRASVWVRAPVGATTRNYLIYDEMNSSQIVKKTSQNSIYDGFVTILDNVIEWASQIKSNDPKST